MPQGKGTYGSKVGRPKKPKNAREAAIKRRGQKTVVGKFMGKMMTGKASPHTSRDESPLGRSMARAKKYRKLMQKAPKKKG